MVTEFQHVRISTCEDEKVLEVVVQMVVQHSEGT